MNALLNGHFIVIVLGLLLGFTSCVDNFGELASLNLEPTQIVVEGVLIDGQPPRVWVGRTASLLSDSLTFRIPDNQVTVTILEDGAPYLVLSPSNEEAIPGEAVPRTNRLFSLDTLLELREGSTYEVLTLAEGLPDARSLPLVYESAFTESSVNVLSDTSLINGECRLANSDLTIENILPAKAYWVELFGRNQPIEDRLIFGRQLFLSVIDQGEFSNLFFDWEEAGGIICTTEDTGLLMLLIATDDVYSEYVTNRDRADFGLGGIFTPPESLPQNVINGYGYVTLGSSMEIPF